jgi:type IV pilus assembly protein PilA
MLEVKGGEMNMMKKLISRVGRGERGFTLIELLVVVAILGIIAAVVVLNIGSFLGTGAEQAANTEAHQVQTAVIAYMAAAPVSTYSGSVGPTDTTGPAAYLLNPATLQATYTVTNSQIASATLISGSKWAGCAFASGAWTCS